MINKIIMLLAAAGFCVAGCGVQLPQVPARETEKINIAPGTEDLVLDTFGNSQRLLISCSARRAGEEKQGAIIAYNISTEKTYHLIRKGEPADFVFRPHGIDLVKGNNGKLLLFVVNHQPAEKKTINSVVLYELRADTLYFIKNCLSELIVSPNDVTGLPDGSFYVTNDSKHTGGFGLLMEKLFQVRASKIIYKSADDQYIVAAKRLAYANGIATRDNKVWIACTFKKDLVEYSRNADGTLTKIKNLPGLKGMDNISFYGNNLVVASHPSFKMFLKHIKASENLSPGIVSVANLNDNTLRHIYANDGSAISANSVALIYNNTLYIGQVFDGFMLKVQNVSLP